MAASTKSQTIVGISMPFAHTSVIESKKSYLKGRRHFGSEEDENAKLKKVVADLTLDEVNGNSQTPATPTSSARLQNQILLFGDSAIKKQNCTDLEISGTFESCR